MNNAKRGMRDRQRKRGRKREKEKKVITSQSFRRGSEQSWMNCKFNLPTHRLHLFESFMNMENLACNENCQLNGILKWKWHARMLANSKYSMLTAY